MFSYWDLLRETKLWCRKYCLCLNHCFCLWCPKKGKMSLRNQWQESVNGKYDNPRWQCKSLSFHILDQFFDYQYLHLRQLSQILKSAQSDSLGGWRQENGIFFLNLNNITWIHSVWDFDSRWNRKRCKPLLWASRCEIPFWSELYF